MSSVIYYWIDLSVYTWSEKKKTNTYTCLVPPDCSGISGSLGFFLAPRATIDLCLYTVSSQSFSMSFLAQGENNNGKNILQNS